MEQCGEHAAGKAAIYASTTFCNQEDIDRQILECRNFARVLSFTVESRHIYTDNEIGGRQPTGRRGLGLLLVEVGNDAPEFEHLLIDRPERLSEDFSESCLLVETLGAFGITVWSVSDSLNLTLHCFDTWQCNYAASRYTGHAIDLKGTLRRRRSSNA